MKKSLIYTSLLCLSINLIYANNSNTTSNTNMNNTSTVVSKTISLITQSGAMIKATKDGLKVFNNTTLFNVPLFKSSNDLNIYALAEQSDGKIIVGGNFNIVNGYKIKDIVRLKLDGSVDKSFMQNYSGFNGAVYALEILQDDSILVGGYFTELGDENISKGFVKLANDGSIDTKYSELNAYLISIVNDIKIMNNKIFLAGTFIKNKNEDNQQAIMSIFESGEIDKKFSKNVHSIEGDGFKLSLKNTSLFLAGDISVKGNPTLSCIIKMNTIGNIDSSFSVSNLDGLAIDIENKNDKLIIAGELEIKDKKGHIREINKVQLKIREK